MELKSNGYTISFCACLAYVFSMSLMLIVLTHCSCIFCYFQIRVSFFIVSFTKRQSQDYGGMYLIYFYSPWPIR